MEAFNNGQVGVNLEELYDEGNLVRGLLRF